MRGTSLGLVLSALLASVLGAGCEGQFTTPPEPGVGEGVRPRCGEIGESLRIEPVVATVGAGQLFVFTATGGTGVYRWSLTENVSGGEIDPSAGVYVAGAVSDPMDPPVDVILLEDRGCRDEASATVTVVEAPRIVPAHITLGRGESVSFTGEGGSGTYAFALATNGSGGTVDAATGAYTAGTATGRDVVRLSDTELGATADAIVEVVDDPSLRVTPGEWAIPLGGEIALPVQGGSGEFDVTVTGPGIRHVDGTTVRADADGRATVTFTDRFIPSRSVDVEVFSLAPAEATRRHDGDQSGSHVVGGTADFDGDGAMDVVVGMPFGDGDFRNSGLVLIYRGTATGVDPTPARVINGPTRDEEFGTDVQVADLDGDGRLDLLIGSRRADPTRRDIGAVYVYGGVEGELFSAAPIREFFGTNSFDLFGDQVEVCDFNGDSIPDLAVSAPFGQDPDGAVDQGVIQVFLGYPGGRFISTPDVQIYGQVLVDGALVDLDRMRLGEQLAAGDYDGDGVCDLAAHAIEPAEDMADTGAVYLFRGRPVNGPDRGGPETTPSLVWARDDGMDDNTHFGADLQMGDVDGDGRADLIAGRDVFDGAAGNDTGAIYVRLGRELTGPATAITEIEAGADARIEGEDFDNISQGLAVFDMDGDGDMDIVSGDPRGRIMDSMLSRPGLVRVYHGGNGPVSTTPDRVLEGTQSDERFGLGVGALGDVDGDGQAEVVAFAPYHDTSDTERDERGALFVALSRGELVELELPIVASGQQVGRSVRWVGDLDGDGHPELAVGQTGTDVTGSGRELGSVRLYRGTAAGAEATPFQELIGFAIHSSGDEYGAEVRGAGDFDGDGNLDVAVLSRGEDSPATPPAEWSQGCGRVDNPGAVAVFLGAGDGTLQPEPSFLYFGPFANQRFEDFDAGFDFNGDGRADFAVGGREWDPGGMSNAGGVGVVFGRPAPAAGTLEVICAADWQRDGTVAGERLGFAISGAGDLDRDGCDDLVAGTPEADPLNRNEGGAVVMFGFDAANCGAGANTSPRETRLTGPNRDAQAGRQVAGGRDLTGDSRADLLIGADQFRDARGLVGRVYLVSGQYVADNIGSTVPLLRVGSAMRLTVDGTSAGERLGMSLAVGPDPSGGGLAFLGGPFGASSGRVDTGGVVVYSVSAMGFAQAPRLIVAGESVGEGQLGSSVHAAPGAGGGTRVAVGAPWSSLVSVDDGASYAFSMSR